ncbi:queuosine precursor transporter [Blastococcus sp. Marseille-P5729]|uniref:queuosine precursor transporter n=1 Tax=Blastococcus sp. Marseille-P5729 TaxID=2086582 RepID=UPI000D112BE7|nr:queuosine precursor transporter [Blastococcus sp. Marseille-P5729]
MTAPTAEANGRAEFAATGRTTFYPVIMTVFCALLLISNVTATKPIELFGLPLDGGAVLFPLSYVLGDVLAEVYGFARAKRAIWVGFALGALASLVFWAVDSLPSQDWAQPNAEAFHLVLGFVPAIVLASLCGYLAGQFLNSWVLVKMKERTGERSLWSRLIGSTVVGELADTFIFCLIATAIGPFIWAEFWKYFLVGYVFKCLVEVVMLPVTYRVIAAMKRHEPEYRVSAT